MNTNSTDSYLMTRWSSRMSKTLGRNPSKAFFTALIGVPLLTLGVSGCSTEPGSAEDGSENTTTVSPNESDADSTESASEGLETQEEEDSEENNSEEEVPEEPQRASEASSDPDSIHVLANRKNALEPRDYEPSDLVTPEVTLLGPAEAATLRQEAAEALEDLINAAAEEGEMLGLTSGYRSHAYQLQIYSARHAEVGTEGTDLYMARPGHSEHQTGLAADVSAANNPNCNLGECFAETSEGQWVADNSHDYGFIIRYPDGQEEITGYPYEPWHLRYLGVDTATEVFDSGLTLEEYWEVPAAPDYDEAEPTLQ